MPTTLQTRPEPTATVPPVKRRRPLAELTNRNAPADRSMAARVLAENPVERLSVAGFNSSL